MDRLRELEADHAKLAGGVPEDVLDLYRRLFVKKGDAAVVPLESEICGGCHMKVPTQISAQVRGRTSDDAVPKLRTHPLPGDLNTPAALRT